MATDDQNAVTAAKELIRLYGKKAEMKADEALRTASRNGDVQRIKHWTRTREAIDELRASSKSHDVRLRQQTRHITK